MWSSTPRAGQRNPQTPGFLTPTSHSCSLKRAHVTFHGAPVSLSCTVALPHCPHSSLKGRPGLTCAFDVVVRDAFPMLHERLQKVKGGLPLWREQKHDLHDMGSASARTCRDRHSTTLGHVFSRSHPTVGDNLVPLPSHPSLLEMPSFRPPQAGFHSLTRKEI